MVKIADYLAEYKVQDLKRLCKTLDISNYSKLKKEELIDEVIAAQKSEEAARYAFLFIDDLSFKNWEKSADNNDEAADYTLEEIFGLYIMGYAFESKENEDTFFITKVVSDLFEKVNTEENKDARIDVQRKLNLIRAALHLYGIVSIEQLLHLFKKYYSQDMDQEGLIEFLEQSPYEITIDTDNGEIVIDDMTEEQYEVVKRLQKNRPYYEPEFAKFIKFSDPNFIDESTHHVWLREWVGKNIEGDDTENYQTYIGILQLVMQGGKQNQVVEFLAQNNVEFKNAVAQKEFFKHIDGILNNTRHFKFRGHKESELKTKTIVKEEKVGRNDPCPCGSGKKYKKCCGR